MVGNHRGLKPVKKMAAEALRILTRAGQENLSMVIAGTSLKSIDFAGLRIFDYTAGHDLSSSLAIIDVPPSAHHAEAWSKRSDKYYLVIAGATRFVLDGVETELSTGDFCFVPTVAASAIPMPRRLSRGSCSSTRRTSILQRRFSLSRRVDTVGAQPNVLRIRVARSRHTILG